MLASLFLNRSWYGNVLEYTGIPRHLKIVGERSFGIDTPQDSRQTTHPDRIVVPQRPARSEIWIVCVYRKRQRRAESEELARVPVLLQQVVSEEVNVILYAAVDCAAVSRCSIVNGERKHL